jgi:hypothetical protein
MIFKTAIAGVVPRQLAEATVMTVYPSMAEWPIARTLGTWYQNRAGLGNILTVGNLLALMLIPVSLLMFALRLWWFRQYRLTNRRIVVERLRWKLYPLFGFLPVPTKAVFAEDRAVALDRFDSISIETKPGDAWYSCGDLCFRQGGVETFRLSGVRNPASFRQTCWNSHLSYVALTKQGLG